MPGQEQSTGAIDPSADDLPVGRNPERHGEYQHQVTAVGAELGSRLGDCEGLDQPIIEHLPQTSGQGCIGCVVSGRGEPGIRETTETLTAMTTCRGCANRSW